MFATRSNCSILITEVWVVYSESRFLWLLSQWCPVIRSVAFGSLLFSTTILEGLHLYIGEPKKIFLLWILNFWEVFWINNSGINALKAFLLKWWSQWTLCTGWKVGLMLERKFKGFLHFFNNKSKQNVKKLPIFHEPTYYRTLRGDKAQTFFKCAKEYMVNFKEILLLLPQQNMRWGWYILIKYFNALQSALSKGKNFVWKTVVLCSETVANRCKGMSNSGTFFLRCASWDVLALMSVPWSKDCSSTFDLLSSHMTWSFCWTSILDKASLIFNCKSIRNTYFPRADFGLFFPRPLETSIHLLRLVENRKIVQMPSTACCAAQELIRELLMGI